jgi:hypothetical protein
MGKMEKALGKLLAKLEIMIFEASEARIKDGKIVVVIKGVPDREISLSAKTESWKVDVKSANGVMEVVIEGRPEDIERDVDDIAMVITASILLTIPRLYAG